MSQLQAKSVEEKHKDRQEGQEYRRLAEQNVLEQLEVARFRKLTQKETKTMYDKALDDKRKVKQMEQELDEVNSSSNLITHYFCL